MQSVRSNFAVLCILLMLAPAGAFPQSNTPPTPPGHAPDAAHQGFWTSLTAPYTAQLPGPSDLTDSPRLETLLRAGNLYLSLQDTIALALENNLDIELQRYTPRISENNLFRAQAGGFANAPTTNVVAGPASVGGGAPSPGLQGFLVTGNTAVGPTPPSFDPALVGGTTLAHITTPQSSSFTTGTNALVQRQTLTSLGVQENLTSGTLVNLALNNNSIRNNAFRSDFNPATNAGLSLSVTQHLLQGFGPGLNTRQIHIARNNREISDLTFKAQVITTISAITDLYWDLVSFSDNVRVRRDALAASQRLLENDRRQVEVGTLAPIEVTRAQAEIASGEQALTIAQTQLFQQETVLKNALSRTGVQNPALAAAHVILTDSIHLPALDDIQPIQDMAANALSARPELSQFRIMIQNQDIAVKGAKSGLLPTLDVVGNLTNNGLAGAVNSIPAPPGTVRAPTAFFIGGYATALSQIFNRNFPTYSVAFNLNIPIRNRTAQADLANSALLMREQQLGLQRMENQVRLEVQNAAIGVQQARAQYNSAVQQRTLQEETVAAEHKKLDAGVSTTYNVILTERDLVTAQSNEVAAMSAYAKARVELDRATGQTITRNNISLEEASHGKVARQSQPPR